MPLNPLTLNVTSGVVGRPFTATISGQSAGSTLEVGIDGTPGFSTVNGRVFSQALPYAVNTLVLRETLAGEGVRESRIDIAADGVAVGASVIPSLVAAAIPAALAPLPVMPDRRLPYVVAPIGDSRSAATYTDPEARNLSSASPLNWANARLSQRFVVGDGFGKSGDRTDQVLARVPAAIASGAGMMLWQAALNDISQSFPTASTSGATAFANTRIAAEQARAAGVIFIAEAEVGADNLNASQVAQVNEYNALLFEYAERATGVSVHDARPTVMQSGFGDSQVRYRTNYSYDGVHPNGRGASYWGESLAALLDKIVPPRASPLIQSRTALPSNGRRQLLLNPIFATATGGTLQTGVSGTIPANFVSSISAGGSSTATLGTQADAGGMGNNVTADVTFAQASARFQFFQDVNAANYLAGDIVRAVADVEITGTPNNLAALYLQLQHNTGAGGQTYDSFNLFGPVGTGQIGPDKAVRLTLATRPYVIRPAVGAGGYMSTSVRAIAAGSGGCQFIIRQLGLQRRDTAY